MGLSELVKTDLLTLLSNATDAINEFAEGFGIPAFLFYIIGLVLAVGVGILGYKLIKLLSALIVAVAGYYLVGGELYFLLVDWMGLELSEWLVYIPAAIFGVIFFFIGFKKFSYAFFALMALIGYALTYFYTEVTLLAIGAAILLAFVCMYMVRFSFIVLTSFAAGMVSVACLSALLPDIIFFQMAYDNLIGVLIAVGVALIFAIIQLVITRNDGEKVIGKKSKDRVILLRRRLIRDL